MKDWMYFGIALILAIVILKYGNRISSLASSGNPNYPPAQDPSIIGPQGPNDGSNNPSGSGSYKFPW